MRFVLGNVVKHEWLVRFSDDGKARPRELSVVKIIILYYQLYGYETWSLTLREEQRLRMFENKVFRKIFGGKRDEITGEWRKFKTMLCCMHYILRLT